MRLMLVLGLLLTMLFSVFAAPVRHRPGIVKAKASVSTGPRRPANRSEAKELAQTGRSGKANVRRVVARRMVHGHWVQVSRIVRAKTVPVVPPHPDPDRLREIQKALADKGYFKGDVNGVWNADSVAALKQFQTDKNLSPDGKISALSLIGLGLGPKHEGNVATLSSDKTQQISPQ